MKVYQSQRKKCTNQSRRYIRQKQERLNRVHLKTVQKQSQVQPVSGIAWNAKNRQRMPLLASWPKHDKNTVGMGRKNCIDHDFLPGGRRQAYRSTRRCRAIELERTIAGELISCGWRCGRPNLMPRYRLLKSRLPGSS